MIGRVRTWLKRHPRLTYLTYMVVAVLVLGEIAVRLLVGFDPSYYMAHTNPAPGAVMEYPYGTISFNSDGHPDAEFEKTKSRPRIGYVGDSVCFGVGAGYGYRVSEVLEEARPEYEHLNVTAGLGTGMSSEVADNIVKECDRFDLDVVVYLLNLNDILPDSKQGKQVGAPSRVKRTLDWFRGRSYLYTYARYVAKNVAVRMGYNASGHQAYERFPEQYADIFAATCQRVRDLDRRLREKGVALVVVLLPYEMQVSQEAAETYALKGVAWEGDGFIDRGPQRKLLEHLDGLTVIDAYYAFVDPDDVAGSRSRYKVGECFVYNRGDKLDWNHPNRKGHRLIAEYIARQGVLREGVAR